MVITIDNNIDESAIGGNASAEAEDEGGADDCKETGAFVTKKQFRHCCLLKISLL